MNFFKKEEFSCKDGCGVNNCSADSLMMIDEARRYAGIPFKINRAASCKKHNKRVGGSDTSSHIADEIIESTAYDISCTNSRDRMIIVKSLFEAGFNRVGIAKTFIHADKDNNKPANVLWVY